MRRRRTSSMSLQPRFIRGRHASLCALLVVTVVCFVLAINTYTRTSFVHPRLNEHVHSETRLHTKNSPGRTDENDDDKLFRDNVGLENDVPDAADERKKHLAANCTDDNIYFSNEHYDCDGIMRGGPNDKTQKNRTSIEWEPGTDPTKLTKPSLKGNTEKENNQTEETPRRIFLNCGNKLPVTLDLFLDTYPSAELFELYSFISDKTYSILYTNYLNHSFMYMDASDETGTKNEDIQTFGSGFETTQSVHYIDIASWILANTKQSDSVVMVLNSMKEKDIIKHLITKEAVNNVDKYYSSGTQNRPGYDLKDIQTMLGKHNLTAEVWDTESLTYSDYDKMNPKHIPTPGVTLTNCTHKEDDQKFLLLLYSPQAGVNALKVINLLQSFAHSDRLGTWLFLPYEMFKFSPTLFDLKTVLQSFHVGLYYSGSDGPVSSLRNMATYVNRLFEKYEAVLEYILVSNETGLSSVVKYAQDKDNYKVLKGGIDITHVSSKIKKNAKVDLADTGQNKGDILLINIDTTDSEYLAVFSLRHFIPWLLSVKDCVW